MNTRFTDGQIQTARLVLDFLRRGQAEQAVPALRSMQAELYASIPDKQRQSRGITWVLQQISSLLVVVCDRNLETIRSAGLSLYSQLAQDDLLIGVPVFLMAEYGKHHPEEIYAFFEGAAGSQNWVVREFAAAGFHKVIAAQREQVQFFLKRCASSSDPNVRRFSSETLRPVTDLRWINQQPEYSLTVLSLLFKESHPYPRTSVGNNLSDLSRRQPELVFSLVEQLVALEDENSTWIAHRACRNLVKSYPERVLDLLGVDEYHYKDRHYFRDRQVK